MKCCQNLILQLFNEYQSHYLILLARGNLKPLNNVKKVTHKITVIIKDRKILPKDLKSRREGPIGT